MILSVACKSEYVVPEPGRALSDPPGRPLDYITGAFISVCTIPFVLGNVVMVLNRRYPPIKSKSVDLTVISSLGGLVWVGATLVVNNHFGRRESTVWTLCPLWTFWMQACFGFALWLNCLILRLINLFFILILKRGAVKCVTVALLVLLSPIIVFCIVASAFRASRFQATGNPGPDSHGRAEGDCTIKRGWSIGLLSIFPLYFCIFVALGISLRNVRPIYNEFKLIINGGILSLFLFLLSLVTIQTQVYREVTGRCFLVLAVSGAVSYYFWARNAEVIYNALFHKQEYLEKFKAKLDAVPSSSQSRNLNNPAELLLFDAREESSAMQAEVSELEQILAKLQERHQIELKHKGRTPPSRQESVSK